MGFVHLLVIPICALCIWLIAFSVCFLYVFMHWPYMFLSLIYSRVHFSQHFYVCSLKNNKTDSNLAKKQAGTHTGKTPAQWSLTESNAEQGWKELNQSKLHEWQVGEWPAEPKHTACFTLICCSHSAGSSAEEQTTPCIMHVLCALWPASRPSESVVNKKLVAIWKNSRLLQQAGEIVFT